MTRALPAAALALLLAAAPVLARGVPPEGEGCGVCHGAERVLHGKSVHRTADLGCVSCHGGDPAAVESKEAAHAADRGFLGRIDRTRVPVACGTCHSDVARMRPYGLRADVLDAYRTSHHGKAVLEEGRTDAATCADCHGVHDVLPVTDPRSPAHRTRVPATCGRCHADASLMKAAGLTTDAPAEFAGSVHGVRLARGEPGVPSCADCHDAHAAAPPGAGEVAAVCGTCHRETQERFRESAHFEASRRGEMNQCVTCHGNHAVDRPDYHLFDAGENGDGPGNGQGGTRCLACHDGGDSPDAGGAVARRFGADLRGADERIREAARRVDEVAAAGFFTDDEREALEQARRELVRAVPLTHTLDVPRVEASVRRSLSFVDEALLGCERKIRESRDRRIWGTFGAVALFGIAGFFALRRRRSAGR